MPRAATLLLLAALTAAAPPDPPALLPATDTPTLLTLTQLENGTVLLTDSNNEKFNGTELDPVVRKKRTFGDIVFRGLADVLGYQVVRRPAQDAFPPPLAPVPGIDSPLQAGAAPPCPPRAMAPSPCAPPPPPPPPPKPTPPPCPRPRAAPKPRPPPPPPCATPRANPAAPPPCGAKQANPSQDTVSSNLQLSFNFNRVPATQTPAAEAAAADQEELAEPIAIEPRAAPLPRDEPPRKPRVYVDAFVVRDGVARKAHALDAQHFNENERADAGDDYLDEEDEEAEERPPPPAPRRDYDDYEDVQESRDRGKAVKDFGTAVDKFWNQKKPYKKRRKLPSNHYKNVHFGDRDLADQIRRGEVSQSLRRDNDNRINLLPQEAATTEDDAEITTSTEDPQKKLRPRVLPPTEHNPSEIDTVTVRVPPIYKEKRPKKYHRKRPARPDRDEDNDQGYNEETPPGDDQLDSDDRGRSESLVRRRKPRRRTRSTHEEYTAGDYDYYGNKLPVSPEEEEFSKYVQAIEEEAEEEHRHEVEAAEQQKQESEETPDPERLQVDPDRTDENERTDDEGRSDDSGRADDSGKADDSGRADERERDQVENERAHENERSDRLSPNAKVRETGYRNNFVRAHNLQVDDPRPLAARDRFNQQ